jgi:hypothetical protein
VKAQLYVSDDEESVRFGLIAKDRPVSLLPESGRWYHMCEVDTSEMSLPEAVEEEIHRSGYWATRLRHSSVPTSEPGAAAFREPNHDPRPTL